jgi:DNA polymerase III delta prime subunit
MGFSEFLGNERIVAALRGALRSDRVPHALLFSGPRGLGKYTLARMFAQAANCDRLKDDFCGECETCKRIALLADPQALVEQGLLNAAKVPTPLPSNAPLSSFRPIQTSGPWCPTRSG